MTNAAEVVGALKKAMGSGDLAAARKLMHDDMTFRGPFDSFAKPEPYLEALHKLHSIVKGVHVHKMFVDGDDVCMLYDMETNSPAGTAFIAEWLHVRAGKVVSIRTVFDARPFAPMFAK
jgi:ketosteroid isomerase-like protein